MTKRLFAEYREFLYKFFLKHVKVSSVAEDFAHDVFVKFWQRREADYSVENMNAWLYTLARNRLADHYRRLATERKYAEWLWQEMKERVAVLPAEIHRSELENEISSLLQTLPPRQREIYELNRNRGLSLEEIAQKLDISPNTAKNHLVKALKKIRSGLSASYT